MNLKNSDEWDNRMICIIGYFLQSNFFYNAERFRSSYYEVIFRLYQEYFVIEFSAQILPIGKINSAEKIKIQKRQSWKMGKILVFELLLGA